MVLSEKDIFLKKIKKATKDIYKDEKLKSLIPSHEELYEKYKDIMENEDITSLSNWTLDNLNETNDEESEEEYLQRGLNNTEAFKKVFKKSLDSI